MASCVVQNKIPVAFVTGATGGIGRAIVDRLLRENFAVAMFSRTQENLDELFSEMRDAYPMTLSRAIAGDVKNITEVEEAIKLTESQLGSIDLLVTAHGANPMIAPAVSLKPDQFRTVIETDLIGTFNVCQKIGHKMVRQKFGRIVNLSSIHSIATYPARAPYAAAKAAVVGLTKALALEWGAYGVTVNTISPWQVKGKRTTNANGHTIQQVIGRSPQRRLINASDIAEAVMFLWHSEHMNGHNLVLDGGTLSSAWYMDF